MKDCSYYIDLICLRLDGQLDEAFSEELNKHLAECNDCARSADILQALCQTAKKMTVSAPEKLLSGVMDGVKDIKRGKLIKKRVMPVAFSFVATAAVLALIFTGSLMHVRFGSKASDNAESYTGAQENEAGSDDIYYSAGLVAADGSDTDESKVADRVTSNDSLNDSEENSTEKALTSTMLPNAVHDNMITYDRLLNKNFPEGFKAVSLDTASEAHWNVTLECALTGAGSLVSEDGVTYFISDGSTALPYADGADSLKYVLSPLSETADAKTDDTSAITVQITEIILEYPSEYGVIVLSVD